MRVIAGDLGGRKLKSVPGKQTRPTSDKIKEAIFQMIGPFFHGGRCLDLFAGSGSLGIEAISRGMDHVVFVDKQSKAIQTVKENIVMLKIEKQTEVMRMDAMRALRLMVKSDIPFDLILIDPPYESTLFEKILNEIVKLELINKNGMVYFEHDVSEGPIHKHEKFEITKQVKYGSTTGITIYRFLGDRVE